MTKYFLGIDTSAYTTSIGLVDENGRVIADKRKVLAVRQGQRGLRQQEAIFQHIKNFPELLDLVAQEVDFNMISSVAVSTRPRNREDSYMPVFKYGESQAKVIARLLGTRYEEYSHQEGHIGSALLEREKNRFLTLHISGGTTELLSVKTDQRDMEIDIVGETKDISIGQLIDRMGVRMGFEFPAGKIMERVSRDAELLDLDLARSFAGLDLNLSGLESQLYRLIATEKYGRASICKTLFSHIAEIIADMVERAVKQTGNTCVYCVGGVSSNKSIRDSLARIDGIDLILPKVELSTDNGVGLAYLAKRREG